MSALIEACGVDVWLAETRVLHGIDFAIQQQEIVTILGPNGSGKTTLLRALLGAVPVAAGYVRRRKDLRIGYVPQRLAVDRTMPLTVGRFLALAGGDAQAREATLLQVGIPGLEGRQLGGLSGGQFQRALLAHALLREPELLVLDEPTQGLDQPGTVAFYDTIAQMRQEFGCGVLMVSHDLHVVMSASDRVICVNGHICCEGTPTVVSAAPAYRAMFGYGTGGALALYRHQHDHHHDHDHARGQGPLPAAQDGS